MVSKKKILWHKLFNKKEFHYNLNSNKESIKKGLIQPYNLAKIIPFRLFFKALTVGRKSTKYKVLARI